MEKRKEILKCHSKEGEECIHAHTGTYIIYVLKFKALIKTREEQRERKMQLIQQKSGAE